MRRLGVVLVLLLLLALAACGGEKQAPRPVAAPKAPPGPPPKPRPRPSWIRVVVLDGDLSKRVRGARVTVAGHRAVTSRKGVARILLPHRGRLVTMVAKRGYDSLRRRVRFVNRPLVVVRVFRKNLQWTMYGASPGRGAVHRPLQVLPEDADHDERPVDEAHAPPERVVAALGDHGHEPAAMREQDPRHALAAGDSAMPRNRHAGAADALAQVAVEHDDADPGRPRPRLRRRPRRCLGRGNRPRRLLLTAAGGEREQQQKNQNDPEAAHHSRLVPTAARSYSYRVDRSFETDARAKPARPDGGVAKDASVPANGSLRPFPTSAGPPRAGSARVPRPSPSSSGGSSRQAPRPGQAGVASRQPRARATRPAPRARPGTAGPHLRARCSSRAGSRAGARCRSAAPGARSARRGRSAARRAGSPPRTGTATTTGASAPCAGTRPRCLGSASRTRAPPARRPRAGRAAPSASGSRGRARTATRRSPSGGRRRSRRCRL